MNNEIIGCFTLLYELISELIKGVPYLFKLFLKFPFMVQESILLFVAVVIVPKVVDFVYWLIEKKKELDNRL